MPHPHVNPVGGVGGGSSKIDPSTSTKYKRPTRKPESSKFKGNIDKQQQGKLDTF